MRIAIAPNAFRGSLSAFQAVECVRAGLTQSALAGSTLELISMPLADGGDGTLDVLLGGLGGERLRLTATGPLGAPVEAELGLLGDGRTAVVELAQASGVERIPRPERNPLLATTYGTGELIAAAWARGYQRILIGVGGSATVEGGVGCLQALGARLLDSEGNDISRGGAGLARLESVDAGAIRAKYAGIEIVVLCDVTNPLLGPSGAARVFGPQKGADPAMVETLEANLTRFAGVIRRDLGTDITTLAGGGAAGGIGAGLHAFLSAELAPGGAAIISALGYDKQLAGADLVITGEGKLDGQTGGGKAARAIAAAAAQAGVPVVALAGTLDADAAALRAMGIQAAWSIAPGPCTLETALDQAGNWLTRAATQLGNLLALPRA